MATSRRPASEMTESTARVTEDSSVTSSSTTRSLSDSRSESCLSSFDAAALREFTPRMVAKTKYPLCASVSAIMRPKPALQPVIKTTFSFATIHLTDLAEYLGCRIPAEDSQTAAEEIHHRRVRINSYQTMRRNKSDGCIRERRCAGNL